MQEEKQIQELKQIIDSFNQEFDNATNLALETKKGGDEKWYNFLDGYEIEPLPEIQKQMYYSSGMNVTKGAVPAELRKVYQIIRNKATKKYWNTFKNIELSVEADFLWDDFLDRLGDFIKEEIDIYIGKIKQKVTVSDVFANAFSGMNKYSQGLSESGLNTKQCNSCGSPRLDEDQYDECYFCGTPLFETKKAPSKCKICGSPQFMEDKGDECRFCGS